MKRFLNLFSFFLLFMALVLIPQTVLAAQLDLASGNLVVLEDRSITETSHGNVTVVLGNADIKSDVNGSVIVLFSKVSILGNVSGDVVSVFGELELAADSGVGGNLVSVGKLDKHPDVAVNGTMFTVNFDVLSMFESNGIIINALILSSLIILAMGLILITVFSARFRIMSYGMNAAIPRRLVLGGLVVVSLTIILAFFIFFMVAPALYILFLLLADIMGSIFLGTLILKNNNMRSTIYLQFFVGHILISILKIVPLILIPSGSYIFLMIYGICFLIVEFFLASFGVGTVIDTRFGKNTGNT